MSGMARRPGTDRHAAVPAAAAELPMRQLLLIGLACAVCVANNYYSQPLLVDIARDLGMPPSLAGLAPTLTQAGIAAGMLLFLPLGDRIDNRRIVVVLLAVQSAALIAMAGSASASAYLVPALVAGMCGIVTYLLPAYATRLVAPARRGAVTGTLATGILTGIMLGRSLAGIAGYAVGWRTVYVAAAVATMAMAVVMGRTMPDTPNLRNEPYAALLASLAKLTRETPLLRLATLLQALSFGTFNALWVGLTLRLQAEPFHMNTRQIGLLGLVAVTGAMSAPVLGRLADRASMATAVRIAFAVTAAGWLAMLALPTGIVGIVASMVLVGVGAIGTDVTLRTALYGLQPDIRMRLNAVYSTGTFLGGSLFSFAVPVLWTRWGWPSIIAVSLAATAVALLLAHEPRRSRPEC